MCDRPGIACIQTGALLCILRDSSPLKQDSIADCKTLQLAPKALTLTQTLKPKPLKEHMCHHPSIACIQLERGNAYSGHSSPLK